jgi:hypothetical protein
LPISARPESREVLAALDIREFSAHLWLGGYLLYPWPGQAAPPRVRIRSICVVAGCIKRTGPNSSAQRPWPLATPAPPCMAGAGALPGGADMERRTVARVAGDLEPMAPAQLLVRLVKMPRATGRKPSGCFWWRIFGRMCRDRVDPVL